MKMGFSFGRCVRDIVTGQVDYEDVYMVVSRTMIRDSSHVKAVIEHYLHEPQYLLGLDADQCQSVAKKLYLSGKLHQPRLGGFHPMKVAEDMVWMDLSPPLDQESQSSPQVQKAWKDYQMALKLTSPQKPDLDRAHYKLRDDF
jgi:hypothetical protein